MTRDPQTLAEGWAKSLDRSIAWAAEMPDVRRNILADRLVFHLALMDLDWAHPLVREAAHIRSDMIVSEIGWPKAEWLKPRVEREIALRNEVHDWLNGNGPAPSGWITA